MVARSRTVAGYAIPGIIVFFFWLVIVILAIILLAFIVHWAGDEDNQSPGSDTSSWTSASRDLQQRLLPHVESGDRAADDYALHLRGTLEDRRVVGAGCL